MEIKSMIHLVLVKRDMLKFVHNLYDLSKIDRGNDRKRREVVNGKERIRIERLRE